MNNIFPTRPTVGSPPSVSSPAVHPLVLRFRHLPRCGHASTRYLVPAASTPRREAASISRLPRRPGGWRRKNELITINPRDGSARRKSKRASERATGRPTGRPADPVEVEEALLLYRYELWSPSSPCSAKQGASTSPRRASSAKPALSFSSFSSSCGFLLRQLRKLIGHTDATYVMCRRVAFLGLHR